MPGGLRVIASYLVSPYSTPVKSCPVLVYLPASRFPCCPTMLVPGDPPPVFAVVPPVTPFPGGPDWVHELSRPWLAPVTTGSEKPTIPAPSHSCGPSGYLALGSGGGWRSVNSTSNTLVCLHERPTKREPSLVVDIADIS